MGMSGTTTLDINPTFFNFLSDVISIIIRTCVSFLITIIFSLLMSWHLTRRKRRRRDSNPPARSPGAAPTEETNYIPLTLLGFVPGDFLQAAQFMERLPSIASFILLLLLIVADFSHSIADLGLEFVTVPVIGPQETVLSLLVEDRNSQRLLQTSGDPLLRRTVPYIDSSDNDNTASLTLTYGAIASFLRGAEDIARYDSPFVDHQNTDNREVSWNGAVYRSIFRDDDTPITSMDLAIPVNCSSSEMLLVPQKIETIPLLDPTIRSTALVPNCTFSGIRTSGVHPSAAPETKVETVELAFPRVNFPYHTDTVLTWSKEKDDDGSTSEFQQFNVTAANRRLARDRDDWREGRRLEGVFDGIRVGSLQIDLGAIVLATGPEANSEYSRNLNREIIWTRRHTYMFVAEIVGECPPRPSGLTTSSISCIAFIKATCDSFTEDFQSQGIIGPDTIDDSTKCDAIGVKFLWGRNFVADAELVAVIASIYSRVQPNGLEPNVETLFFGSCVQAAMFALGTLRTLPSIEQSVNPRINSLYYTFMVIPLIVACMVAAVVHYFLRPKRLDIPMGAWELMVLAKEQDAIHPRQEDERKKQRYPKEDETLAITLPRSSSSSSSSSGTSGGGVIVVSDEKYSHSSLRQSLKRSLAAMTSSEGLQQTNQNDSEQEDSGGSESSSSSSGSRISNEA